MSPPVLPVAGDDPRLERLRARLDSLLVDAIRTGRRGVARPLNELNFTSAQQAKYEQLRAQRWAHDDAVDDLAADEWDALVQGGMDATEATRQLARKYHR